MTVPHRTNPRIAIDSQQIDVAIIGGGLAGLACAIALRDTGLTLWVFEADAELGGRARSWTDERTGDAVDVGPHILLSEYRNMLGLMELLGTSDRIVWQPDPLIRLREGARVTDMHLHALPPPFHLLPSFGAVRDLSWRDKLSNWRIVRLALRFDEQMVTALDGVSAADLLRRHGVTPRLIQWFWASACMALLNVPLEHCSAAALMRVFSQLVGIERYRIGFPNTALGELFAPAAADLIRESGGRVHTRTSVDAISRDGDGAGAWNIQFSDGARLRARFCVLALPPQSLLDLIPEHWGGLQPFHDAKSFEPSPYISSYIWFDRKLTRERFWARIWSDADLNTDFYDLSNIRAGWSDRPSVIASNIIFSHRANCLSDAQILATTVEEVAEAFPGVRDAVIRHVAIHRIPMAIPCPAPGVESKRPANATPLAGLYLAGDWTRTALPASMESAVHSGFAAAEEIWRAIGRPRTLVLPKRPTEGLASWMRPTSQRRSARARHADSA
ncbi:MAG TPA: hydroxysqualene dehydroxylase HpnE [Steroidobacteraceae bacterium]|nr:hydroxysqualene dehydroxylase HpnE [Steroidobacteraceae bacterium]